jgi:hypothetical protein
LLPLATVVRKHGRLSLTELEEVASLEKRRAALIEVEMLGPKDVGLANIELFKRAESRRANGLPDRDWDTRGDVIEDDE